jgi:hypothetical protein
MSPNASNVGVRYEQFATFFYRLRKLCVKFSRLMYKQKFLNIFFKCKYKKIALALNCSCFISPLTT